MGGKQSKFNKKFRINKKAKKTSLRRQNVAAIDNDYDEIDLSGNEEVQNSVGGIRWQEQQGMSEVEHMLTDSERADHSDYEEEPYPNSSTSSIDSAFIGSSQEGTEDSGSCGTLRDNMSQKDTPDKETDNDSDDDTLSYKSDIDSTCGSETILKESSKLTPNTDVPYMVEAFQPLIECTVDYLDILPHLPFLDTCEFKTQTCPKDAMHLLISRLFISEEPGKWEAFLQALKEREYEYIVRLLRGDTEEDHTLKRTLLKLFTPKIMYRIDPDQFIDHLFEQMVITGRDMEEVKCEKERRGATAASFMLLDKVPRRASNWFEIFVKVLKKCGMDDIANDFDIPEVVMTSETPLPKEGKQKKKRKLSLKKNSKNPEIILTPSQRKKKRSPNLPPLPPVPNSEDNLQSRDSSFPLISTSFQASQTQKREINHMYKNLYEPLKPQFKLDELNRKVEDIEREIEQQRLINEARMKLRLRERELKALKDENESTEVEDRAQLSTDVPSGQTSFEDAEQYSIGSSKVLTDAQCKQDPEMEVKELIFNELKQIRRELDEVKTHVTEAVLKNLTCSVAAEIKTIDYNNVDVFRNLNMAEDYNRVKLFSSKPPATHLPMSFSFYSDYC